MTTTPFPDGLLLDVQRRLEHLYALDPQLPVTDFLLSEDEAARFPGSGSRTLVHQEGEDFELGVVFDSELREALAHQDPRRELNRENLDPFCALTEEISHFLYLLFCAQSARSITQLELELQGEVDKYLSAVFLLSLQNDGAVSSRLRDLLFHEYSTLSGLTSDEAERYHEASALAYRYCGFLETSFLRPSKLDDLARESRRFYRLGQRQKLERIAHHS